MAGTAPEREAGSSPSYTLEVDSGDGPALHPGDRSVDMLLKRDLSEILMRTVHARVGIRTDLRSKLNLA